MGVHELERYIRQFFGVAADDLEKICSLFQTVQLERGSFFLKRGGRSDRLGFVQHGIIREFTVINAKEVTKWISTKGYFAVDLASFVFDQPARWNIQALTDCELFVIDNANYKKIHKAIPNWPQLEKLFIAKCFTTMEERIVTHLAMSAEERYRQFFEFNSSLFNQVPLQYLASMLGMTPETLSRLRKKTSQ